MTSLSRALVPLAWLDPAGILVQAVLAGQAIFVSPSLFGLHGGVGHGVLLLAILTAVLAWANRRRPAAWLGMGVVVALVAQIGLGYTGHRAGMASASAWHVALGVALLGTSVAVAMLLTLRRASAAHPAPSR